MNYTIFKKMPQFPMVLYCINYYLPHIKENVGVARKKPGSVSLCKLPKTVSHKAERSSPGHSRGIGAGKHPSDLQTKGN